MLILYSYYSIFVSFTDFEREKQAECAEIWYDNILLVFEINMLVAVSIRELRTCIKEDQEWIQIFQ